MKRRNDKGATLAEMTVVLAVIVIISMVVVSFSVMVSNRVKVSRHKLHAEQDLSQVELVTETWIVQQAEQGAAFSIQNGVLIATVQGTDCSLSFSGDTLSGKRADAAALTCLTETVTAVSFHLLDKPDKPDTLFFCTVTYQLPLVGDDERTFTHTFCINPYLGEVF